LEPKSFFATELVEFQKKSSLVPKNTRFWAIFTPKTRFFAASGGKKIKFDPKWSPGMAIGPVEP
jgi:hypothetical protein